MYRPTDWFTLHFADIMQITKDTLDSKRVNAEVKSETVETPAFLPGEVLNVKPEKASFIYRIGMDANGTNLLIACFAENNPANDPRTWRVGRDLSVFKSAFATAIE